jgi:hypothetical protein
MSAFSAGQDFIPTVQKIHHLFPGSIHKKDYRSLIWLLEDPTCPDAPDHEFWCLVLGYCWHGVRVI